MSKKLSRSMIFSFLIMIMTISYYTNLLLLSLLSCFWLGFVVSAIVFKEQENLTFWVASKGVPIKSLMKEEEKHERTERESDGKAEQEA